MVSKQDAQNHTCKGREFSDETPEKALHDEEEEDVKDLFEAISTGEIEIVLEEEEEAVEKEEEAKEEPFDETEKVAVAEGAAEDETEEPEAADDDTHAEDAEGDEV